MTQPPAGATLSVHTWNVCANAPSSASPERTYGGVNDDFLRKISARLLRAEHDVICLQEVYDVNMVNALLHGELGQQYDAIWVPGATNLRAIALLLWFASFAACARNTVMTYCAVQCVMVLLVWLAGGVPRALVFGEVAGGLVTLLRRTTVEKENRMKHGRRVWEDSSVCFRRLTHQLYDFSNVIRARGALRVRVRQVNGCSMITVINTHLNEHGGATARAAQLADVLTHALQRDIHDGVTSLNIVAGDLSACTIDDDRARRQFRRAGFPVQRAWRARCALTAASKYHFENGSAPYYRDRVLATRYLGRDSNPEWSPIHMYSMFAVKEKVAG